MKKTLLTVLLVVAGIQMNGCAAALSSHPYQDEYGNYGRSTYPENEYGQQGEFTYDDNYADVDWDNVDPTDMYYSYYDTDNVFLCAYGNRIFMIPYDFFYSNIWSHHRFGFRYYPYSYFANWWGIGFYNHVWDRYYWNRHNGNYRRGFNYYNEHRRHPPTILRRGELRDPRYGRNSGRYNRFNRSSGRNNSYGSPSNRFSNRNFRYKSRSSRDSSSNLPYNRFSRRSNRGQGSFSGNSNSYRYRSPRSSGSSGYSTRGRGFSSSYGSSSGGRGGSGGYSTRGRGFSSSSGSTGGGRGGSSGGSSHGHATRKK